jgi:hypothetical protein
MTRRAFRLAMTLGVVFSATAMLAPVDSHAFGSGDNRGSAGFRGLLLAPDARSVALGGASVALSGSTAARTNNPAALARISGRSATLSATSYILDIMPAGGIVAVHTSTGVWSLSVYDVSYGDFDAADQFAGDDGTFDANDIAVHVGWAGTWSHSIRAGASVGLIRSRIAGYSASAVAVSAGLQLPTNDGRTTLGVAVTNLGTALSSYIGGDQGMTDEMPTSLHAGVMHRPEHFPVPLALSTEIELPRDDDAKLSLGAELRPFRVLALRVGYDSLLRYASSDVEGESTGVLLDDRHASGFGGLGLRLGAGLALNGYEMDYAYAPAGPFGGTHHMSLRLGW